MVNLNEKEIFGGLFLVDRNKIITNYAGISDGYFNHLQNGVMALSYLLMIQHAKDIGCSKIDFGTTRPFLQDGLYKFKRKWGMNVEITSPFFSDIFSIRILSESKAMKSFLHNNKFFYLSNKKLKKTNAELLIKSSDNQGKYVNPL